MRSKHSNRKFLKVSNSSGLDLCPCTCIINTMHMPTHRFLHIYKYVPHKHAHTHLHVRTYTHACTHTPHTYTHTHTHTTSEQDLGLDALSKALRRQQEVGLAIQEEVTEHNGEEHTPSSCLGGEENPDT